MKLSEERRAEIMAKLESVPIVDFKDSVYDKLTSDEVGLLVETIIGDIPDSLDLVTEFTETFHIDMKQYPEFPSMETIKLRLNLMFEELSEFAEACGYSGLDHFIYIITEKLHELRRKYYRSGARVVPAPDLVEALDALCDMRVVNDGTILALGLQHIFSEAFEEVHSSNMSKLCKNFEEASESAQRLEEGDKELSVAIGKTSEGRFILSRRSDYKVLKPISFVEPKLNKFIPDKMKGI